MAQSYIGQKRPRRYYGKIREDLDMPNLIEVQKSSYDMFLQSGDAPGPMDGEGIKGVFQSVFPIKDFNETSPGMMLMEMNVTDRSKERIMCQPIAFEETYESYNRCTYGACA